MTLMSVDLDTNNQLWIGDTPLSEQMLQIWGATELGPDEREYVQQYGENYPNANTCHSIYAFFQLCNAIYSHEIEDAPTYNKYSYETGITQLPPSCVMESYAQRLYEKIPDNQGLGVENVVDLAYWKTDVDETKDQILYYLADEDYLAAIHCYIDYRVLQVGMPTEEELNYHQLQYGFNIAHSPTEMAQIFQGKAKFIAKFCPTLANEIIQDFLVFMEEEYCPEQMVTPDHHNENEPQISL